MSNLLQPIGVVFLSLVCCFRVASLPAAEPAATTKLTPAEIEPSRSPLTSKTGSPNSGASSTNSMASPKSKSSTPSTTPPSNTCRSSWPSARHSGEDVSVDALFEVVLPPRRAIPPPRARHQHLPVVPPQQPLVQTHLALLGLDLRRRSGLIELDVLVDELDVSVGEDEERPAGVLAAEAAPAVLDLAVIDLGVGDAEHLPQPGVAVAVVIARADPHAGPVFRAPLAGQDRVAGAVGDVGLGAFAVRPEHAERIFQVIELLVLERHKLRAMVGDVVRLRGGQVGIDFAYLRR